MEYTTSNILTSFIIGIEIMYIISLFFIPDLISILCIIFSMISIMTGLIASMHLWGLTISPITMSLLILSVGFCIDFSAHLTHCFIASVGKGNRSKRAYAACMRIGMPIVNSAVSTILGICVLAFSRSYFFMSFFKTILLLMCLGVIHSMIFLPVLLSLIGPYWSRHKENNNELKQNCNQTSIENQDQELHRILSNNNT
jgi:predicted RND superfamily exporter protein